MEAPVTQTPTPSVNPNQKPKELTVFLVDVDNTLIITAENDKKNSSQKQNYALKRTIDYISNTHENTKKYLFSNHTFLGTQREIKKFIDNESSTVLRREISGYEGVIDKLDPYLNKGLGEINKTYYVPLESQAGQRSTNRSGWAQPTEEQKKVQTANVQKKIDEHLQEIYLIEVFKSIVEKSYLLAENRDTSLLQRMESELNTLLPDILKHYEKTPRPAQLQEELPEKNSAIQMLNLLANLKEAFEKKDGAACENFLREAAVLLPQSIKNIINTKSYFTKEDLEQKVGIYLYAIEKIQEQNHGAPLKIYVLDDSKKILESIKKAHTKMAAQFKSPIKLIPILVTANKTEDEKRILPQGEDSQFIYLNEILRAEFELAEKDILAARALLKFSPAILTNIYNYVNDIVSNKVQNNILKNSPLLAIVVSVLKQTHWYPGTCQLIIENILAYSKKENIPLPKELLEREESLEVKEPQPTQIQQKSSLGKWDFISQITSSFFYSANAEKKITLPPEPINVLGTAIDAYKKAEEENNHENAITALKQILGTDKQYWEALEPSQKQDFLDRLKKQITPNLKEEEEKYIPGCVKQSSF